MGKPFIFQSKPMHVTPQMESSKKKQALLLTVSTHIYGVSKEIDEENIHF